MGLLIALGLAVLVLVIFDLVAARYGFDSRDQVGDDHGFGLTPRWQ